MSLGKFQKLQLRPTNATLVRENFATAGSRDNLLISDFRNIAFQDKPVGEESDGKASSWRDCSAGCSGSCESPPV